MEQIIQCPNCDKPQQAKVIESTPFFTYIHHCTNCKYIITESEWKVIKNDKHIKTYKNERRTKIE